MYSRFTSIYIYIFACKPTISEGNIPHLFMRYQNQQTTRNYVCFQKTCSLLNTEVGKNKCSALLLYSNLENIKTYGQIVMDTERVSFFTCVGINVHFYEYLARFA